MANETISGLDTMSGGEKTLLAGRYRPVKALGQGGMGSVWLAEDTALDNHQVALKLLPPILVSNRRALQQLKAEALVSLKLTHPNIAALRSFEENDGNPFLVMDFIDGQTLDDYLAEKGTLDEEETLRLLRPVAEALDYAHREKVVHRDVKPGNVMIRKDGTPFVLDFGIAREIQETLTRVTGKLSSGTLLYMSPEQLRGEAPKSAQDVYSFAAMAYECLKGDPPFSRGQIEWQILNQAPQPLSEGVLAKPILQGLAKMPAERPSSCLGVLGTNGAAAAPASTGADRVRAEASPSPQPEVDIYLVEAEAKDLFERKVAGAAEPSDASLKDAFRRQRAFFLAATGALSHGDPGAARRLFAAFTQAVADYEAAVAEVERQAEEVRQAELARRREEERQAEAACQAELIRWREEKRREKERQGVVDQAALEERGAIRASESRGFFLKVSAASVALVVCILAGLKSCRAPEFKFPAVFGKEARSLARGGTQAGEVATLSLPQGVEMTFVWCPPGAFTMGSQLDEQGRAAEETPHRVTLSQGFWMGQFEVTQRQWKSVMGDNPSDFKGDENRPVEHVSWEDCQRFVAKFNALAKGVTFSMPTEAQWEYACRAGSTGAYAGTGKLDEMGWCADNSGGETHPVGRKRPNAWNLYDMHGNVWEWCADWHRQYKGCCVVRGGSWNNYARHCRSAYCSRDSPSSNYNSIGVRLVCSAGPRK